MTTDIELFRGNAEFHVFFPIFFILEIGVLGYGHIFHVKKM